MKLVPTVMAWILVALSAYALFWAFVTGFGSFYHQNSDVAHLSGFFNIYALMVFCAALFLAFLLMSKRNVWTVAHRLIVLGGFVGVTCAGFWGYVELNPPVAQYKTVLNGAVYAVPRAHSSRIVDEDADVDFIYVSVCVALRSAYRGPECEKLDGVGQYDSAQLSDQPITDGYWVSDVLDVLVVASDGDRLGKLPDTVVEVDGVTILAVDSRRLMLELDGDRVIQRAVWCRQDYPLCSAFAQTAFGTLRFPTLASEVEDKARWSEDQAAYEAIFAGWRCEDQTCGGLFPNGAVVAYED